MNDFCRVVVPSVVVGGLMVLVDVYSAPWFSHIWWVLHPGP